MTRYINADALIKNWENVHSKDISFAMAIIGAINDVKKAPTIDAVPIEWIEEWCLSQNLIYIRLAVEKLLEDWKEENAKTN